MTLKINSMYPTATGFIIPRSHANTDTGEKYCIVQVLTGDNVHYTSHHTTMSHKELRKALKLPAKERIETV